MTNAAAGRVAAVIPAAGSGTRLASVLPKAFVDLGGLSLLTRSALTMSAVADVIAIAAPADQIEAARDAVAQVDAEIHIVAGGENRQASVAACLAILPADIEFVLIHDAARPLVPVQVASAVLDELRNGAEAVIPVLPIADTVKRVGPTNVVVETIDRTPLRNVQTPQGFTRAALLQAYSDPAHVATDDAGLMETIGIPVHTVAGSELAMKITTALDLQIAQLLESAQK